MEQSRCRFGEKILGGRMTAHQYPLRGEIYYVNLPGKPSSHSSRPALVVSMDVRNRLADDVIVVPLTTTQRAAPTHVHLDEGEGGLDKPSMAKCEQITTIDKSLLIKGPFAGTVSPARIREIEKAIQRAIGIFLL